MFSLPLLVNYPATEAEMLFFSLDFLEKGLKPKQNRNLWICCYFNRGKSRSFQSPRVYFLGISFHRHQMTSGSSATFLNLSTGETAQTPVPGSVEELGSASGGIWAPCGGQWGWPEPAGGAEGWCLGLSSKAKSQYLATASRICHTIFHLYSYLILFFKSTHFKIHSKEKLYIIMINGI